MVRCCGSGDERKSRDRHRQAKNPRITHEFGPRPGCRANICSLNDCPRFFFKMHHFAQISTLPTAPDQA